MSPTIAQVLWQSPDMTPVMVALLTAMTVSVLWLYPPQTQFVPIGWRWVMPALRGMAVAALAIAMLRPAVLRPRTAARQGPLVLLVDRSHSMSAVDRDRTPAELVALAAGLNALPANVRPEAAPGLRGRLDAVRSLLDQLDRARSEAEYARLSGRSVPAAAARLRDAGERLRTALTELPGIASPSDLGTTITTLKQRPLTLDDPTVRTLRAALNASVTALAQAQAQADEKLFRDDAAVRSICTTIGSRSRRRLVEAGLAQSGGLLGSVPTGTPIVAFTFADELRPLTGIGEQTPLDLEPSGSHSDVTGAVRTALGRLTARGPQAIVLMSDGRQVGGEAEGISSDVSAAGVPIFTVMTAAAGQRRDVSILRVDSPSSARVGQPIRVHVELRGIGFNGSAVDVRLDAGSVRQIKRVVIGDDASAGVDFDVILVRPGPSAMVVNVTPLAGESSDQNNRFQQWIKIGAESARVLVIAGAEAGRQYASLHAALSRAPWVALREVEDDEIAFLSARSIAEQDVVVLCDVAPSMLSDTQWASIEQVWRERGGSVILCSGRRAPMEYMSHPRAARLLPFEPTGPINWRTWPGEEPRFRVVPTSAIEAPAAEMEFWRQLPPVSRFIPLPPLRSDTRALLVERESGSPVLTETRSALGRLYFIATDQTWRWRGQAGGEERDRFWPQLVRLAVGEPYAAVEGNVWFDIDQIAPEPDRSFNVRARVLDAFGEPTDSPTQTLHILRDGVEVRQVALALVSEGSGLFRGTVSGLPAGQYTLRVDAPEDPSLEVPPDSVELDITVASRLEAELANLSGDDQLLRRIADASGGQFLTLDELAALPQRLAENRQKQSALVEYTLWDSPYLFGFVLACLSAEWATRKRFGLA